MILYLISSVAYLVIVITTMLSPIPKVIPKKLFWGATIGSLLLLGYKYYQYFDTMAMPPMGLDAGILIIDMLFCMKIRGLQHEEAKKKGEKKWWMKHV